MTFSDAVPNIVGVLALVFYLVGLAGIVWAFYIAYLLTRALRKYLRS